MFYNVPDFAHTLQVCGFYIPYTHCRFVLTNFDIYYLILISQTCKGEEPLSQGHMVSKGQSWDLNPDLAD